MRRSGVTDQVCTLVGSSAPFFIFFAGRYHLYSSPKKPRTNGVQYAERIQFVALRDVSFLNTAKSIGQINGLLRVDFLTMRTGKTLNHFSAGSATLQNVDTEEEDLINLDSTIVKRCEPV